MGREEIGKVFNYYSRAEVAAIVLTAGELKVGDTIKIVGHTTSFDSVIDSMEVNNAKVEKAVAGDYIGVKVADRTRPGDEVFKVIPD